jgi:hypothetical protein
VLVERTRDRQYRNAEREGDGRDASEEEREPREEGQPREDRRDRREPDRRASGLADPLSVRPARYAPNPTTK